MKIFTISLVAAASLAIGGLAVTTTPARAWAGQCPANMTCLFGHADYGWLLGYRGWGGLANIKVPAHNDQMSSWINNSGSTGAWYTDANGRGICRTMHRKTMNNWVGGYANDTLTSWRTNHGCD